MHRDGEITDRKMTVSEFVSVFASTDLGEIAMGASTDLGEIALIAPRWQDGNSRSCTDHTIISAEAAQRRWMAHK